MPDWTLTPELDHFVELARRYCETIERAQQYELGERLTRCAVLLASLYAAGLNLPVLDEPDSADALPTPGEVGGWPAFEEMTLFWQVPDAYAWGAPEITSLTETLLQIYREIKRGLLAFDDGYAQENADLVALAAWHWQTNDWRSPVVDALRALNRAIQKVNTGTRDF